MVTATAAGATIHSCDMLDVQVYNHPEFSKKVTVDSAGRISYPLAGAVQVAGLEPQAVAVDVQLLNETTTAEGDPVFGEPAQPGDVIVVPVAPRVTVSGLLANPGVINLKVNSSLVSALYTAGGPAKFADLHHVQVLHNGGGERTVYDLGKLVKEDLSQNTLLQVGDMVFVPQGSTFDPAGFLNNLVGLRFLLFR